jgi:peptide/nickel transport system substrate-binding protein
MKSNNKLISFFNALFIDFHHLSLIERIERAVKNFRPAEKIAFYTFAVLMTISSIYLLFEVNKAFLMEVPTYGGSFTEGVIGSPRFINPVLAISDTDKDLTSLIYAGLLKSTPEGKFVPDLAESYSVSEDGLTYHIVIKENALFQDGKRVTTDDVIFTIDKALDSVIKSPRRLSWDGVSIQKISDREIDFTLKKPYAPFAEALTMGILPRHIWQDATSEEFPFSEYNVNPVGAGPYKVEGVKRNNAGILTSLTLSSSHNYALGRPKIDGITFKFYQNENDLLKAYESGEVESVYGMRSEALAEIEKNKKVLHDSSLPRIFGIFFNQSVATVFLDRDVRRALDIAAPKEQIVENILFGYGKVINGPTPEEYDKREAKDGAEQKAAGRVTEAKAILEKAGWKADENGILTKKTKTETVRLAFSISTSDAPELRAVAEELKNAWQQIGADVQVKVFEAGDLSQNVIRPRKYEALLFGEVINQSGDLYPFWHSSERNDPGLNIALYANISTDKLLEQIRAQSDEGKRQEMKSAVVKEIKDDVAAIFLFSPDMVYIPAPQVKNIALQGVTAPSERFENIKDWYIQTDSVWKFFAQ